MKKLSLNHLKLGKNDLLQRDQLKTVFGGYGGGDYNCGVRVDYDDGYTYWSCGLTQEGALGSLGYYPNLGGSGPAYVGTICCDSGCSGYC